MLKIPNTIRKIANFFESFPEIGPRQALRLAFYVARSAKDLIIQIAKEVPKIKQCPNCFYFFDDDNELCNICRDSKRNKQKVCMVINETSLISIENANFYDGVYFILGDFILDQKSLAIERLKKFKEIIKKNEVKEIILSFPITLEGKITAKEVREELSSFNLKFFEPKIGLPKGSEIEFVDPETLKEAFKF
jgi:recombination protein RecR